MYDQKKESPAYPPESVKQVEEEHESLKEMFGHIEDARDLPALRPLLEDLEDLLVRHFALEEGQGGLFESIVMAKPRFLSRVEEIKAEHRVLLADLQILLGRVRSKSPPEATLRDARHFALRMQDHEHRETELIAEVAFTELGGGG